MISWGSLRQGSPSCDETILRSWSVVVSLFERVSTFCKAIKVDMMAVSVLSTVFGRKKRSEEVLTVYEVTVVFQVVCMK